MDNNIEFQTVAAGDLGSNSFHMIVVSLKDQQMKILDRLREQVVIYSATKNIPPFSKQT